MILFPSRQTNNFTKWYVTISLILQLFHRQNNVAATPITSQTSESALIKVEKGIYIPFANHCMRLRFRPKAYLVGFRNDPTCLYNPPESPTTIMPPPGYRPGVARISKYDKRIHNTFYFKKFKRNNNSSHSIMTGWNGTITLRMDENVSAPTITSQNIEGSTKEFDIELSLPLPPSPTSRPSVERYTTVPSISQSIAPTPGPSVVQSVGPSSVHSTSPTASVAPSSYSTLVPTMISMHPSSTPAARPSTITRTPVFSPTQVSITTSFYEYCTSILMLNMICCYKWYF